MAPFEFSFHMKEICQVRYFTVPFPGLLILKNKNKNKNTLLYKILIRMLWNMTFSKETLKDLDA